MWLGSSTAAVRRAKALGLLLALLLVAAPASGQSDPVTVPDVIGLTVPEAAALLNRSGLVLGAQISETWTEASGAAQNTIGAQAILPGETGTPTAIWILSLSITQFVKTAVGRGAVDPTPAAAHRL